MKRAGFAGQRAASLARPTATKVRLTYETGKQIVKGTLAVNDNRAAATELPERRRSESRQAVLSFASALAMSTRVPRSVQPGDCIKIIGCKWK